MSVKSRLLNILFWSIISAAFIGPGTITTASKAGADHGLDLLWALLFSTFACLVLQEASARISIVTGLNLGQALRSSLHKRKGKSAILILIGGSVLTGIAAYQTGNILGAVSGMVLIADLPPGLFVVATGLLAGAVLSIPSLRIIARLLGGLVAIMGIIFLLAAILIRPPVPDILSGMFVPRFPQGGSGGLLVLGLIGTTVVPYNLFLGSGLAERSQSLREMRIGLGVAVIFGGIISMAVLVTGTAVDELTGFRDLGNALNNILGGSGEYILGFGLFAAGFTSAVTAPLAAAITTRSVWGKDPVRWQASSIRFRSVWLIVLILSIFLGLTDIDPIPAIIMAQALNGLILPLISIFLLLLLNSSSVMGQAGTNNWIQNAVMALVVGITLIIGLTNIIRSVTRIFNFEIYKWDLVMMINILFSVIVILLLIIRIFYIQRYRKNS